MTTIESNLQAVRGSIASSCRAYARSPEEVTLVAVSKTFGPEAVQAAYDAGQRHFGENYVQECVEKVQALKARCPEIVWHFIGPLQSNKTRLIAEHCDWVHGVDRLKIAERLSEQRSESQAPLQVCLQVNVSDEATKSGVALNEVEALAAQVAKLPRLKLRGLMAIPEPTQDFEAQRRPFARMRELLASLNQQGYAMDTLSMGMSADMTAALAEGATLVRVGTAIFGKRI
jgi:pyridoxal phosphate enzyme (YggS family)